MQLRTRDGQFLAFRESIRKKFVGVGSTSRMDEDSVTFRSSERQKIIDFIIRSRIRDSGAELSERAGLGKHIEMSMPLHMHARLEGLYTTWVTYWAAVNWTALASTTSDAPQGEGTTLPLRRSSDRSSPPNIFSRVFLGCLNQPLDSIASYYGEGVAFYFAWLEHCCKWLIPPAFLGTVQFIVQVCLVSWDPPTRPFFSILIVLWGFAIMVSWRRRSNYLAHRWGTLKYEEEETTRPQYHGEYVRCEITGEWIISYPPWKRHCKTIIGGVLTIGFTTAALIFMLLAYANRDQILTNHLNGQKNVWSFNLSIISSAAGETKPLTKDMLGDTTLWLIIFVYPCILGMLLPLFNYLFTALAVLLNDFENYRTDTEYRNNLILKVRSDKLR